MNRIKVFEDYYGRHEVVSRVNCNTYLDYWDGRNYTNGGCESHLGITKLRDGRFVLIYSCLYGDNYAIVVDDFDAAYQIWKSGNTYLLDSKRFSRLKEYVDSLQEREDEEQQAIYDYYASDPYSSSDD